MGLWEKTKAAVKNADSKAGEMWDGSKIKSDISKEKNEIEKMFKEIGTLYYERHKEDDPALFETMNDLCDNIDKAKEKIASLEKKLEETKEAGKKERKDNWDAANEEKKEE